MPRLPPVTSTTAIRSGPVRDAYPDQGLAVLHAFTRRGQPADDLARKRRADVGLADLPHHVAHGHDGDGIGIGTAFGAGEEARARVPAGTLRA